MKKKTKQTALMKECKEKNEKSAGNNQWTNNNLKYYPDQRKRPDGPGGN